MAKCGVERRPRKKEEEDNGGGGSCLIAALEEVGLAPNCARLIEKGGGGETRGECRPQEE